MKTSKSMPEHLGHTAAGLEGGAARGGKDIAGELGIAEAVPEVNDGALRDGKNPFKAQGSGFLLHKMAQGFAVAVAFVILFDKEATELGAAVFSIRINSDAAHDGVVQRIDVVALQVF